jgi:outer membrane murein-binding lipoprotein Lpp
LKSSRDDTIDELKRIEDETHILEDLSSQLENLEHKIETLSSSSMAGASVNAEDIQEVSTKIAILNALIDKIEVEISQLNSRMDDIESLRFTHRYRK